LDGVATPVTGPPELPEDELPLLQPDSSNAHTAKPIPSFKIAANIRFMFMMKLLVGYWREPMKGSVR
jgi:hypothetical protein